MNEKQATVPSEDADMELRGAVSLRDAPAVRSRERGVIRIRASRPEDGARAVEIWRRAVDATHHFLTAEDRLAIDEEVQRFLPQIALWLAVDEHDCAVAFMALSGGSMEALFVHPDHHGRGIGRALVQHAVALEPVVTTSVNEQNRKAIGFYQRLGFVPTGRSAVDDQGRPYPLLRLRIEISSGRLESPAIGSPDDRRNTASA